uniref:Uncharacterized protein n=1 Tax=Anguilla anguilla TaxID=7936 RepID=A0A0E9W4J0_ANGAN
MEQNHQCCSEYGRWPCSHLGAVNLNEVFSLSQLINSATVI